MSFENEWEEFINFYRLIESVAVGYALDTKGWSSVDIYIKDDDSGIYIVYTDVCGDFNSIELSMEEIKGLISKKKLMERIERLRKKIEMMQEVIS